MQTIRLNYEMQVILTLDKGKGAWNPDNEGVGEWLLSNYDVHKDEK